MFKRLQNSTKNNPKGTFKCGACVFIRYKNGLKIATQRLAEGPSDGATAARSFEAKMPTNLFLSPTRAISLPRDICQERTRFENDSSSISEHLNNVSVVVGETALLSCRVDGDAR